MQILTSYNVGILNHNHIFEAMVDAYRSAVGFYIRVCLDRWNEVLADGRNASKNAQMSYLEKLTLKSDSRGTVEFDFGERFPKLPSRLRRAAIHDAIGKAAAYFYSLEEWEGKDPKKRGRKPKPPVAGNTLPRLYGGNMFRWTGKCSADIKVLRGGEWIWASFPLSASDCRKLREKGEGKKILSPMLRKDGRKWSLTFTVKEKSELGTVPVVEQVVLAVDLGVGKTCACCAMRHDGQIIGRKFLSLPDEHDKLWTAFNRKKKAQQKGSRKTPRLWGKVNGLNDEIEVKTAKFIITTAEEYGADVIVFEHLELNGKIKGGGKHKLHLWRSNGIQKRAALNAHQKGMRIATVNAWNTSRLAFDGSGRVLRGEEAGLDSYALCRFKSGKVYNCNLNASYNIGARYFIREILKSLPETERLDIEAKVPECSKRSTCTLSSLINLNAAMAARPAVY